MKPDLTDIINELDDLACQLDHSVRKDDYFPRPSPEGNRMREIAADLCLLNSLKYSMQDAMKILSRIKQHSETLVAISANLTRPSHQTQLRKVIFGLLNQTPHFLSAIIDPLPADLCVSCDLPES